MRQSLHIQHMLGASPLTSPHMSPSASPPINQSPSSIPGMKNVELLLLIVAVHSV